MRSLAAPILCLYFGLRPTAGFGHADEPPSPHDLASAWSSDPLVWAAFGVTLGLYAVGTIRLWRRAGHGRGIKHWQAASFAAGVFVCGLALIWPLDAMGEALFSAHMAQHSLLVFIGVPLILLGAPEVAGFAAMSKRVATSVAMALRRIGSIRAWLILASAPGASAVFFLLIWFWHMPRPVNASIDDDLVHSVMHASLVAAGVLFWSAVLRPSKRRLDGVGLALLALFGTMTHMGLLSAILVFASRPLYAAYLDRTQPWGLTPLEDQQLAGLIMWVPASLPLLLAALLLAAMWLRDTERESPTWLSPEN